MHHSFLPQFEVTLEFTHSHMISVFQFICVSKTDDARKNNKNDKAGPKDFNCWEQECGLGLTAKSSKKASHTSHPTVLIFTKYAKLCLEEKDAKVQRNMTPHCHPGQPNIIFCLF